MTNRFFSAAALCLTLLIATPAVQAQTAPTPTTFGLSVAIQESPSTIGLPATVSSPIWLSDQFVLAPELGFISRENGTDVLSIGADARFTLGDGQLVPYAGPGLRILAVDRDNPNVPDDDNDLVLSGFGGAEYFFSSEFSLAVEGRLDIRSGDNNTVVGTTGVVRASVYF
ncbi:hypothetical protein [Longibacter salinarum]|nr:hypothetical protein [Longibacter salinarum]